MVVAHYLGKHIVKYILIIQSLTDTRTSSSGPGPEAWQLEGPAQYRCCSQDSALLD